MYRKAQHMAARAPKYQAIAAELLQAITSGEYGPGDRLPGENEVIERWGVSQGTARHALALLVGWGIAETRTGSGVYVREFNPIVRDGIRRLSRSWTTGTSVWAADTAGRNLGIDRLEVGEAIPPEAVREFLGLAEGTPAVRRSRRYLVDGEPVLLSESWLPADIAAGTPIAQDDTGEGGIYARLAEAGHGPVHFLEDLRARMLPDVDKAAEALGLTPGTPVVEITRLAFDSDERVVEVNEMTADASAYVFRYEWDS